ncbi:MAG TPA: polysaccharide biosynthesis tyrosine autokinase [Chthoniobacterales bacterium]|nr:polysaccharide biosynthesis tyrosine autokinase [Chthoniobacterales bacterium]
MDDLLKISARHDGWWERFRARLFRVLRSLAHFWWIPFFTTAAGLAIASWLIFQQRVVYVSSGRMMVSGRINIQEGAVFSEELANFFGTQTELMKSSEVRTKAVNLLDSTDPQLQPVPATLAVSQLPQTSIFVLSTTGSDAEYVRKLLDAIMTEYIATKKEMRSSKSEDTQAAIIEEISRVEREMKQSEQDLLNFQKANNVGYLEQEGNSAGAYVANLNRQLADLKTQYQLFGTMDLDEIIAKTQNDPGHAGDLAARASDQQSEGLFGTGMQPEDQYLAARQQLALLKSDRDELAKTLRPKHPRMVDLADKISQQEILIATLRQQSLDRLKNLRDSIKGQIDNLTNVIAEWDKKALSLSERLAEYNRIKGNFDRTKALYDRLVNNLHEVDITRNVDQDLISILEKATPAEPIKPGFERVLVVGVCGGLLLGLGIIFFLDFIDDRLSSTLDTQSRLDEHILGQVPTQKQKGTLAPLCENDPRHAFAESLRGLRSSLLYLPFVGERPKTILITSAVPNEGKTTIALNLAITMALAKVRVLLVDGDLRRGSLHRLLERHSSPGLSDLLLEKSAVDNCIVPTSVPGLDLLPHGVEVQNPGELLVGSRLDEVLREIYGLYQYIIFDSSPVMAADDSTSLAPKLDASVFIVRFYDSSARVSKRALELLRDRQANVIGIVCNDVSQVHGEYYQYKYTEYYGSRKSAV